MNSVVIPAKAASEIVFLPPNGFNFTSRLQQGETLTGNPTVTLTVYSGTDPSPNTMLSGAASISSNSVLQKFQGGVVGCIYQIVAGVTTSLGQYLEQYAYLVVVSDNTTPSGTNYVLWPGGAEVLFPGGTPVVAP